MAELDVNAARRIAAELVTIGHPFAQIAIDATAMDLVGWCKGVIIERQIIGPQQQAQSLVTEARMTWKEGWPDKGGTPQLHALFRKMFAPAEPEFRMYEAPPPPSCKNCNGTGRELFERNGYEWSKACPECGGKMRPAVVCPDCSGKETKLVDGRREPCQRCLTAGRRQEISEWLKQQKEWGI